MAGSSLQSLAVDIEVVSMVAWVCKQTYCFLSSSLKHAVSSVEHTTTHLRAQHVCVHHSPGLLQQLSLDVLTTMPLLGDLWHKSAAWYLLWSCTQAPYTWQPGHLAHAPPTRRLLPASVDNTPRHLYLQNGHHRQRQALEERANLDQEMATAEMTKKASYHHHLLGKRMSMYRPRATLAAMLAVHFKE